MILDSRLGYALWAPSSRGITEVEPLGDRDWWKMRFNVYLHLLFRRIILIVGWIHSRTRKTIRDWTISSNTQYDMFLVMWFWGSNLRCPRILCLWILGQQCRVELTPTPGWPSNLSNGLATQWGISNPFRVSQLGFSKEAFGWRNRWKSQLMMTMCFWNCCNCPIN